MNIKNAILKLFGITLSLPPPKIKEEEIYLIDILRRRILLNAYFMGVNWYVKYENEIHKILPQGIVHGFYSCNWEPISEKMIEYYGNKNNQ